MYVIQLLFMHKGYIRSNFLSIAHHSLYVSQLKEDHEFDSDNTDVIGPDISHSAIEVRGNMAEISKFILPRNVATRVVAISTMPLEMVQPIEHVMYIYVIMCTHPNHTIPYSCIIRHMCFYISL